MLDVLDFITERGGDPERIRESQRRRYAPVEVVDEVIALFEDHRKSKLVSLVSVDDSLYDAIAKYHATRIGSEINATQKEIGMKKKVRPHQSDAYLT